MDIQLGTIYPDMVNVEKKVLAKKDLNVQIKKVSKVQENVGNVILAEVVPIGGIYEN